MVNLLNITKQLILQFSITDTIDTVYWFRPTQYLTSGEVYLVGLYSHLITINT
jgi:hypothetical protein